MKEGDVGSRDVLPGQQRNRRGILARRAQIWLGLLLGAVALYMAVRNTDLALLIQTLRQVRLPFVAMTLVTSLLTPVLKAARWRWLLCPHGHLPEDCPSRKAGLLHLAELVVIGQAVNFIIPGRWGELVRMYLTGQELGVSKAYALGTIAAEKLVDIVVLALLVIGLLPALTLPDWLAARIEPILLAALAVTVSSVGLLGGRRAVMRLVDGAFGLLLAIWPRLPWVGGRLSQGSGWAERWRARIAAGLDGLAGLGSRSAAIGVWGWTVVFWLVAGLTNGLLLLALELPPSALAAFTLLAVLQAGVAVPSTPGKIGVFHYLCVLGLSIFGVATTAALGYGVILHALVVGGISGWGALALWRRSWNLRRLAEATAGWQ